MTKAHANAVATRPTSLRLSSGLPIPFRSGLPEAHDSADQLFGRERLADVLTAHAGESAGDIHRAIMQSVADFSGDVPRRDDVTLVVIRAS